MVKRLTAERGARSSRDFRDVDPMRRTGPPVLKARQLDGHNAAVVVQAWGRDGFDDYQRFAEWLRAGRCRCLG